MLNINIKERPIYKIFCYISMAYIVGATLWALWISKFMAFSIIPVSALLVYMVFLFSKHVFLIKMLRNMVWSSKEMEINELRNKKLENYFFLSILLSVSVNGIVNPYELNAQLVYFYYAIVCFIWGVIPLFNDITYSTRVNASSTFFKKNTAKRELILKTFIFISLVVILIKLNISLEKLISNDEVLINAMFIGGFVSFFYVLAMVISNLTTAYYVMIFKKELFKEIIKKETGK